MKGSHRHPFLKSCHYSRKRGMRTGTIVVSHLSALHSTTTTTTTPAGSYLPSYPSIILDASRLGRDPAHNRRHAPMVYHEKYSFANWPEKHTFPMDKFARIAHVLTNTRHYHHRDDHDNTTTLVSRPECTRRDLDDASTISIPSDQPLVQSMVDFYRPLDVEDVMTRSWLPGPIDPFFVQRFMDGKLSDLETRWIGFREQTSRPELIERTVLEVAGTILTAQLALNYGIAANLAGGTHHAHPQGGAGYTILNDLAVATYVLTRPRVSQRSSGGIHRVLVIDCDVHQGDGTAKFGATEALKDHLFTLSLHCASNYPHPKASSTFDVGLPDGMRDAEYQQVLEESVSMALTEIQPDLCLYDAGVDIYEHDVLGRLRVTEDGIRKRDRFVIERCVLEGIPVAAVVGGGYDKDVDALARRHAILHEECAFIWRKYRLWEKHVMASSPSSLVDLRQ